MLRLPTLRRAASPAAQHDDDFKEMELWEHLAELRTRLIRCVVWVLIGLAMGWMLYEATWDIFFTPVERLFVEKGWRIVYDSIVQGFTLQLQVSLVTGLIFAIPAVTLELWGFIAPGLTRRERKMCYFLLPLALVFFAMGIFCGYLIMEPSMRWFAAFVPDGVEVLQNPTKYLLFLVKTVVSFGIAFELPLVLMMLAFIGIISSSLLKDQWRICLVGCFIFAALATPGGDPISMVLLALPLGILYIASIYLCTFVERFKSREDDDDGS